MKITDGEHLDLIFALPGWTDERKTQVRQTAAALLHNAEQNMSQIISELQQVCEKTDGTLVGLEYCLKTKESLMCKIARRITERWPRLSRKLKSENAAFENLFEKQIEKINDIIRFTLVFETAIFYQKSTETKRLLLAKGFIFEAEHDFWQDENKAIDKGYRGRNSTWMNKAGQRFELQFHTFESYNFKQDTHWRYEEIRVFNTSKQRRKELIEQQIREAGQLEKPK